MIQQQNITDLQEKILLKHPNWPEEKARWIAMQCLGLTDFGVK